MEGENFDKYKKKENNDSNFDFGIDFYNRWISIL